MPSVIEGQIAPFAQPNVDTDVIMPKRFLKTITRKGLAAGALADLRFNEDGTPIADFILNQPEYEGASILVVGSNFGCGSSREHAVWGLMQLGIKAIIGTDFGGIFYDNARKNGLAVPIVTPEERDQLLHMSAAASLRTRVDIETKSILIEDREIPFEMDDATRHALIAESDETLDTLKLSEQIKAFEKQQLITIKVSVAP